MERLCSGKRRRNSVEEVIFFEYKKTGYAGFMSMEGRYVATVWNVVATMSMEGRYAATAGSVVAAIHRYALFLLRIQ